MIGVSRRHFLKVRSTLVCGCQFVVVLVQFRHLFSCKMILIAMTELLQIAQLEDSGLTSEATDG